LVKTAYRPVARRSIAGMDVGFPIHLFSGKTSSLTDLAGGEHRL
jgi:hypothetical protein